MVSCKFSLKPIQSSTECPSGQHWMERCWLSVFAKCQLNDGSKDILMVFGYRSMHGVNKNDSYI